MAECLWHCNSKCLWEVEAATKWLGSFQYGLMAQGVGGGAAHKSQMQGLPPPIGNYLIPRKIANRE